MSILTETANDIIKGYVEQYSDTLGVLKNAKSEKNFQTCVYQIEDAIKNELETNKYEFNDLLTLLLRGEDTELNDEFNEWFEAFCPDSTDILTFIKEPETLLCLLLCDKINVYTITDVLGDIYNIEAPKPPKPSDEEILNYFNHFCLVHENINYADIIRVLGGLKNE